MPRRKLNNAFNASELPDIDDELHLAVPPSNVEIDMYAATSVVQINNFDPNAIQDDISKTKLDLTDDIKLSKVNPIIICGLPSMLPLNEIYKSKKSGRNPSMYDITVRVMNPIFKKIIPFSGGLNNIRSIASFHEFCRNIMFVYDPKHPTLNKKIFTLFYTSPCQEKVDDDNEGKIITNYESMGLVKLMNDPIIKREFNLYQDKHVRVNERTFDRSDLLKIKHKIDIGKYISQVVFLNTVYDKNELFINVADITSSNSANDLYRLPTHTKFWLPNDKVYMIDSIKNNISVI